LILEVEGYSMDAIQKLILQYDWNLQCWDDRYSRGIWAIVAPQANHTYEMREISDGGDIESMVLGEYFYNEGSWLPVAIGDNLMNVLAKLNEKIQPFIDNNVWRSRVYDAFQQIIEITDGNYGLRIAIDNKDKALLKPDI